jgi:hypothetical protein
MSLLPIYKLDLAERREIVEGLLGRLTPEQQKAFLVWCCRQLKPIFSGTMIHGPILRGAKESWHWLCILCTQFDLDFESARAELERRVRATKPADGAIRLIGVRG